MRTIKTTIRILLPLLLLITTVIPAQAKGDVVYQTGFDQWRAAEKGFAGWTLAGVSLAKSGALTFDPRSAVKETDPYAAGAYYGINFYNAGDYWVGTATSPEMAPSFPFSEAIASWNASTPPGTWMETKIQVKLSGRWSKWYNLGVWAYIDSDATTPDTITRHSVRLQGDTDGYVAVDTLVVTNKKATVEAYKLQVRLFSANKTAVPSVRNLSLAYSTTPLTPKTASQGNPANWNTLLNVPECSQMVYPDGGNVWCSPTSTSMVLGYWGTDPGECEPRVRAAVEGVYDKIYDGHGNWPFNTAYAAARGYEAYVARFTSMDQIEPWVKAGVPVVVSYAWNKGDLTNAAIPSSNGHLSVVVGFDASGNPIINDPAAAADADVQRTYLRSEFEPIWLENSGGTVYLIFPAGHAVPAVLP